ncbi:MAG TPA: carboxypeptidase-like regulatory domain-containing protein [Thermoanaerobaculaceae bacterium]|nr:carboxypeptidase-like regulatory domain-containing protein [Thermoanaerobaculaceae bacterium]
MRRRIGWAGPLGAALVLAAAGCASVAVHGVVRTTDGHPLRFATLTLQLPAAKAGWFSTSPDSAGCFSIYESARRGQTDYEVVVTAHGFKPLTIPVEARRPRLIVVTMAPDTGDDESTARSIEPEERNRLYQIPCEPVGRPGALTLH